MLSFMLSFGKTDIMTDRRSLVKQYTPDLSKWGHTNIATTGIVIL